MNFPSAVSRPILLMLIIIIFSCTTTKPTMPNISIIEPKFKSINLPKTEKNLDHAKSLLREISILNADLAKEIGKLPDLHDGINSHEIMAIEELIRLYNLMPNTFESVFYKMYKIGKPQTRKYCAPLQALFWLAEKHGTNELEKQIEYYKISILLSKAWNFYDSRWDDHHKVMDRLNSPRLFEYWFSHNFNYDWSRFWITSPTAYPQSAESTIQTKRGICIDAAYLACKCLKRAGYDATGLNVYFRGRTREGAIMHSVCIINKEYLNRKQYYKLGDTNSPGFLDGPYNSIREIAEKVARRNGVYLGSFNTGVPYYDYSLF